MMPEDNFGYSLPLPELSNEHIAQSLRKEISSSKKCAALSALEFIVLYSAAGDCTGRFPEPWVGTVYSGMILLEILAVGTCLYSAHRWWKTSKNLSELEKKSKEEII